MRKGLFLAALAVIVTIASSAGAGPSESKRLKVTILATNDVHGYIEPCG